MINDIKVVLFLIAAAIASAIIRFKSLTQLLIDAVLGFVMGYSFYLLLGFWVADGATRSGFCGIIILCSRPLYDWANAFILNKLTDLIEKKIK
ncbi:MAG TPA: hypothetical protein DIC64_00515 [Alphaproteobacteria bacterium]|nr:hypothetical protein [Alphaproteobacteria bacterium]